MRQEDGLGCLLFILPLNSTGFKKSGEWKRNDNAKKEEHR